jgi:glycosyltransferase involved in cell wall biosynthesis
LGVIRNSFILAMLEKWEMALYRSASRIVTVTDAFRENLVARGVPSEKLVTITNGADTDYWNPNSGSSEALKRSLHLEGKFVVLYIGAHGISQALRSHLNAAARLQHAENIRFVFVGEGAEKRGLECKAQEMGLKNVQFLPSCGRDEVREYCKMADLCLVPLRAIPQFDAFIPSKMFEIMSMGRPILASLTGEAAGILRRSGSAKVVSPEDDEALANAIGEMSSRPGMLAEMGAAGRKFVESSYSRRQLASRYLDVIRDATEEWREGKPV